MQRIATTVSSFTTTAAVIAALAGGAEQAAGNHHGYWNSNRDFYVRVSWMPDFDQKRASAPGIPGLPGDGGMYCAPTAISNLFAYIDRHGYDGDINVFGPGVMDWSDPGDTAAYNAATTYINGMGNAMNTDAEGGTSNTNNQVFQAIRDRLDPAAFDVSYFSTSSGWAPTAITLANVLRQGGIATLCYGRYNVGPSQFFPGTPSLLGRETGHCVTLTKVDRRAFMNYGEREFVINFANPSSFDSDTVQDEFRYQVEDVRSVRYATPLNLRWMTRILFTINDPDDTRHRLIDSVQAIYPKAGWSVYPDPASFTVVSGGFTLGGVAAPTTTTFASADGTPIVSAQLSPDRTFGVILTAGNPATGVAGGLFRLDPATGTQTRLADVGDPRALTFNRDQTVIYADGSTIVRLEPAVDLPEGERPFRRVGSLPAGATATDLSFDDATDRVVAASADGRQVFLLDAELVVEAAIPTPSFLNQVRRGRLAEDGALFVQDADGTISWLVPTPGAGFTPVARWSPPAGSGANGLSIGDDGHVFTVVDGVVVELEPGGGPEVFVLAEAGGSPLAGQPAGAGFEISRSRTNFIAAEHSGPAWENIDPSELEPASGETGPCLADLVRPFETLDIFDILAFFELFGEGDGSADLNADGSADIFDILAYFDLFGRGC